MESSLAVICEQMKIEDENHTGRYFSGHSAAFPNAAQKKSCTTLFI
jgi:hypothetical protein